MERRKGGGGVHSKRVHPLSTYIRRHHLGDKLSLGIGGQHFLHKVTGILALCAQLVGRGSDSTEVEHIVSLHLGEGGATLGCDLVEESVDGRHIHGGIRLMMMMMMVVVVMVMMIMICVGDR